MEEKFYWTGTISAPKEYPMEIYEGDIIADDFTYHFDAIWCTQNTGWGNNGGIMSVSKEKMDVPTTLKFTWLSLIENKFYTGQWKLDKEKIAKLFAEGFINDRNNQKETYRLIKIGLAPKGKVVVWLSGTGFQTEVGSFEAKETVITKEQAYDNAKYMFEPDYIKLTLEDEMIMKPDIKHQIEAHGYPPIDIYETYRKRYTWRPAISLPQGDKTTLIYYNFVNGEEENRFGNDLETNPYIKRALPSYITILWKDKAGKKNGFEIRPFDEQEIRSAFEKLGTNEPIDLDIKIDEKDIVTVSLKNRNEAIKLSKGKISISKNLD